MFKRILLTLTFVAAFGVAGLCLTENAEARWGRVVGRPYASYYAPGGYYGGYAPVARYGYSVPSQMYYAGYAPRVIYTAPPYYYRPRVAVRVGGFGW